MSKTYVRIAAPLLLAFHLGAAQAAADVASQCVADLDDIASFMRANDAGASAALADHGRLIEEAYAKSRVAASEAKDETACGQALFAYLRTWRRGHLNLMPTPGNAAAAAPAASKPAAQEKPATDPRAPAFQALDKDTVLLTFASFNGAYRPAVEALLAGHRAELESHKYWIIDVRDNGGGSDSTYEPLLPWLMDSEFVVHHAEWLATPANAEGHAAVCALVGDEENCKKSLAPVVKRVSESKPGTWVSTAAEPVEYLREPKPEAHQPQRVAVLVDKACGSSCEEFLLAVRESFRVKLVGRPSFGSLDVSNMRPHALPSGKRTLLYTTSRSTRMPLMPIDQGGIQPDILLPRPADQAARDAEVRQVQRWLAGGSLRPE